VGYGFGNRIAVGRRPITAVAQAGSSLAAPYAWWGADSGVNINEYGKIYQWNDKSGNGRNLISESQFTGPLYYATAIDSQPAVYFDNTTSYLFLNDTTTLKSIVSVVRLDEYSLYGYSGARTIIEANGPNLYGVIYADGKSGEGFWGSYLQYSVAFGQVEYSTNLVLSVKSDTGNQITGFYNDTPYSQTLASTFTSRDKIRVGGTQFSQPLFGYIAELVVFDYLATDEQMLGYINLFIAKYGLA